MSLPSFAYAARRFNTHYTAPAPLAPRSFCARCMLGRASLAALLGSSDARLRRLVCNDIIGHVLKHQELAELEARLEAIEKRLAEIG